MRHCQIKSVKVLFGVFGKVAETFGSDANFVIGMVDSECREHRAVNLWRKTVFYRVADDCKFNHNDTPLFFAAVIGGIGDVTDKKVHSKGISRKTETANLTYALRSGD